MKKYKYDIHIHSGLSPCGDVLLSPNNILNMAFLNNLDIVSVTDHNCLKQSIFISKLAESYNFIYIIGVEISTFEGVHVLCYFMNENDAIIFEEELSKLNQNELNNSSQYLFDEYDNISTTYNFDLSLEILSLEQIFELSKKYNFLVILAHIDRYNEEVIKRIYPHLNQFTGIEISNLDKYVSIIEKYPIIKNKKIINNSDAHCLTQIATNNQEIILSKLSIEKFFSYFVEKKDE